MSLIYTPTTFNQTNTKSLFRNLVELSAWFKRGPFLMAVAREIGTLLSKITVTRVTEINLIESVESRAVFDRIREKR
jgi:hypothetical protein